MTYEQAIAYWFGRINYEQKLPRPGELHLERMRQLLHLLGEPQKNLRIVHIAGSKGKGSTAAMLASILRQAGYRTGLFTSPHLVRVEERIQVDGRAIGADELTALVADIKQCVDENNVVPTFFEMSTALGFLHFARRRVDVAVVEVGMGGRFDATNVCRPLVSLITSISYDHTRQLGPRLQDIAFEKSGIIKTGIPAISGATHVEARSVIEIICRQRNAPLLQLGRDFDFQYVPASITASSSRPARVTIRTPVRTWPTLQLGLLGEHQGANAAVTVACVEQLRKCGLPIPDQAVAEGLAGVVWPARLEVLRTQPFVILDCAHNVASAQALVDTLLASFPPSRRHLLFAGSKDKDIPGMFRVFAPHFVRCYLTRFTNNPRAASLEELQRIATAQKMTAQTYPTSQQAWEAASAQAAPDDLICITGSVFLAGEMRRILL